MNITLVVAASENNAIGLNNQLLWHLPKDMRFFKNTTWGMPILMGRKTFESMGSKPLNGRLNIIITRNKNWVNEDVTVLHTMEEATALADKFSYKELLVIGGGEIYEMALPIAQKIWLTRVHTTIEGDVYFPQLNAEWEMVSSTQNDADEKHKFSFDFECWKRK
ncbi:MAG: dihydrofolate reductase [Sediminibacterium sp.]|jgi:dihydrofolate reductase|nr:MAG: dihydrofolate reductase [Sediminibacterium sp.]